MSRGQVHNALTRGLLSSALTRAVGDVEGENGLERYGETLTPTLDLWRQPEWAYLRKERLISAWVSPNAVAGENGALSIVNPVGSGNIVVVKSIRAITTVASFFFVSFPMAAAAAIGAVVTTKGNLDSRWGALNVPQTQFFQGTTAAPPGPPANIIVGDVIANTVLELLAQPLVLAPGAAAIAWCNTVNQQVWFTANGLERKAFPGELE